MDSIDETLRKAREVQERYKQFLARKTVQDKSMTETYQKIQKTQQTLKSTKESLAKIDKLYTDYQEAYSKVIDNAVSSFEKSTMLISVSDPDWSPILINPKEAVTLLQGKKRILILTGAGISAASGIPTFRGQGGFWTKETKQNGIDVRPQEILTENYYKHNEFKTWAWLDDFYSLKKKCAPNKAHISLSAIIEELTRRGSEVCFVSQNIDNFHREVQAERKRKDKQVPDYQILEIHGNVTKIRCQQCTKETLTLFEYEEYRKRISERKSPLCPKCQSTLRPNIMFFDEFYQETINRSKTVQAFLAIADLVVIIGTALQTGLARLIVESSLERGTPIIEANISCQIRRPGVVWLEGKAETTLQLVKVALWKSEP